MRKLIKRLAFVMCLVCLQSGLVISNPGCAEAKIKLNKKKLNLRVSETYKLKIKGTKKKVKWSTSKKAVASVNRKGVVRAKKPGTAIITAKVLKKKYNCKVKVNKKENVIDIPITLPTPAPTAPSGISNEDLSVNMSMTADFIPNYSYAVFHVTNKNTVPVYYYKISYTLYDKKGELMTAGNRIGYSIEAGKTHNLTEYIGCKYSSEIDNAKSTITITVSNSNRYEEANGLLSITDSRITEEGIVFTMGNEDKKDKIRVDSNVLFYGKNGKLVAAKWLYVLLEPQERETQTVYVNEEAGELPDNSILFDSYKIFNYAHKVR